MFILAFYTQSASMEETGEYFDIFITHSIKRSWSDMENRELVRLKWSLILELGFAGAYVSITRGLFIVFLVSTGYGVEEISFVMLISTGLSVIMGVILSRYQSFISSRIKTKLIAFHGLERLTWLFIPLANESSSILILFSIYSIFSVFTSTFMNVIIYGALQEKDLKEVLSKRSISGGVSNIVGLILGIFLLAFLQTKDKFVYIFGLGSLIGLFSTCLVMFLNIQHLEETLSPQNVEKPEKVFTASLFFVILMIGGNLLGIVWVPYVMNYLKGPDYLIASMSLVATMSSVVAALVLGRRSLKTLRISHVLSSLSSPIILLTTVPSLHLAISAFNSFVYTGANFLGNFLFAEYKSWYGAIRSSVLLVILGNLSIFLAAPIGMIVKEDYVLAFSAVFVITVVSALFSLFAIPEVSVVSENVARTYSFIMYRSCLTGYGITVEVSKETIIATLRLLAIISVLTTLFTIYRVLTVVITETTLI
ncbi:MAG: hypothetical protein QG670_295 [Thermoproteota archaeon]|nr:hypothetical protein [Thermoproteota archaeon]